MVLSIARRLAAGEANITQTTASSSANIISGGLVRNSLLFSNVRIGQYDCDDVRVPAGRRHCAVVTAAAGGQVEFRPSDGSVVGCGRNDSVAGRRAAGGAPLGARPPRQDTV